MKLKRWAEIVGIIIDAVLFVLGVGFAGGMEMRETVLGILFNGCIGAICLVLSFVLTFYLEEYGTLCRD